MKRLLLLPIISLFACEQEPARPLEFASQEISFIERVLVAADSTEIYVRQGGQPGLAIVFVHGWCIDGSYWEPQLNKLAERYQVVALDLPGHGRSSQDRNTWSITAYAQDVETVVSQLGLEEVILVGHSMGEAIVTEAARLMPDQVKALIGVDTFIDPKTLVTAEEQAQVDAAFAADFAGTVRTWIGSFFPASGDSTIHERIIQDIAEGPVAICGPVLEALGDYYNSGQFLQSLTELEIPIRTINVALPKLENWQDVHPDFGVSLLHEVGHYPMQEKPLVFTEKLQELIQGLAY